MYFPDLTPYTYDHIEDQIGLNVGWLEKGHEFATGSVPDGLVEKLTEICQEPYERYRGQHVCRFCDFGPMTLDKLNEYFQKAEDANALSSTVIRVNGADGKNYYSPAMICHYIEKHGYKPPEEFIKAVMETELPVKPLKIN